MNRPLPISQAQNEAAAARGKAMADAPTWSGTTHMARPSDGRHRNRNTSEVLRNVSTWLKVSASRIVLVEPAVDLLDGDQLAGDQADEQEEQREARGRAGR